MPTRVGRKIPGSGGQRDPDSQTRRRHELPRGGRTRNLEGDRALFDRVTGRYQQFQQAVERTRAGEWNAEDFEAFLLHVYETLTEKAVDCRAFIEESRYHEESPDEVETGLRGVDLYEVGMQELWQYLQDGEASHLEEGLRLLWEGNEKINEAMRINRESREDLDLNFFL